MGGLPTLDYSNPLALAVSSYTANQECYAICHMNGHDGASCIINGNKLFSGYTYAGATLGPIKLKSGDTLGGSYIQWSVFKEI